MCGGVLAGVMSRNYSLFLSQFKFFGTEIELANEIQTADPKAIFLTIPSESKQRIKFFLCFFFLKINALLCFDCTSFIFFVVVANLIKNVRVVKNCTVALVKVNLV